MAGRRGAKVPGKDDSGDLIKIENVDLSPSNPAQYVLQIHVLVDI